MQGNYHRYRVFQIESDEWMWEKASKRKYKRFEAMKKRSNEKKATRKNQLVLLRSYLNKLRCSKNYIDKISYASKMFQINFLYFNVCAATAVADELDPDQNSADATVMNKDIVKHLVSYLYSNNEDLQFESCRCLANLTDYDGPHNHDHCVNHGAIDACIALLRRSKKKIKF